MKARALSPVLSPAPELLVAVAEVGHELAASHSLEAGARQVLRVLERRLGAARSVFYRVDADRRTLTVEAARGLSPEQLRIRYGFGVAGRVAQSDQPVVVPVLRHDPMALSELGDLQAWQSLGWNLIAVPVTAGSRVVGVLSSYFRQRDPAGFAERLCVLEVVAGLLSKALRAARATARQQPETVLQDAESREDVFTALGFVGQSASLRDLYAQISQVAGTHATTLLRGEPGTGKERVARAIHKASHRSAGPLVVVKCSALLGQQCEAELFGHDHEAVTSGQVPRKSALELANGGTLFLDDVGELSLAAQARLLRFLQTGEFNKVDHSDVHKADVRLIAATARDLEREIREGSFREELFYCLDVFTIALPPLRERRSDIPALSDFFLKKFAATHHRNIRDFASSALDLLIQHAWPGNIRELENAIERAVVSCNDALIEPHHLPKSLRPTAPPPARLSLSEAVDQLERQLIEDCLREQAGNIAATARELSTTERIVRYKAQKLGIDPTRFRL